MKNIPPAWKTSPSRLRLPGRAGTFFSKRGKSHIQRVLLSLRPFMARTGEAARRCRLDPGAGQQTAVLRSSAAGCGVSPSRLRRGRGQLLRRQNEMGTETAVPNPAESPAGAPAGS